MKIPLILLLSYLPTEFIPLIKRWFLIQKGLTIYKSKLYSLQLASTVQAWVRDNQRHPWQAPVSEVCRRSWSTAAPAGVWLQLRYVTMVPRELQERFTRCCSQANLGYRSHICLSSQVAWSDKSRLKTDLIEKSYIKSYFSEIMLL